MWESEGQKKIETETERQREGKTERERLTVMNSIKTIKNKTKRRTMIQMFSTSNVQIVELQKQ